MSNLDINSLIDDYGKRVYNLAFRVTGTRADAEDISQETFMQIYQKIDSFKGQSDIYSWIYRITLNNCLQMKRKMDKEYALSFDEKAEVFKDDIPIEVQEWYNNPEKAIYINELLKEIRQGCLHFLSFRLPENQRVVYVMKNVLDFSYKEMAKILEVSESVIKARLNRARANLKDFFGKRCQWLTDGSTCSCKSRIGFALAYDPEILKRVKEHAIESGFAKRSEFDAVYKPSIDDLFRKFPMIEYWGKDILKEKLN